MHGGNHASDGTRHHEDGVSNPGASQDCQDFGQNRSQPGHRPVQPRFSGGISPSAPDRRQTRRSHVLTSRRDRAHGLQPARAGPTIPARNGAPESLGRLEVAQPSFLIRSPSVERLMLRSSAAFDLLPLLTFSAS